MESGDRRFFLLAQFFQTPDSMTPTLTNVNQVPLFAVLTMESSIAFLGDSKVTPVTPDSII